ncbi:hypothetical protein MMC26_000594 [Xylographa opegraphella]|nr:hypothetical protein [Xylographa opegraphella]
MTENTNPGNFANRPKEEVIEAATKGGKSHGGPSPGSGTYVPAGSPQYDPYIPPASAADNNGRNPDGTFTTGSAAAKEAGAKGGSNSSGPTGVTDDGRNPDGTFTTGSAAAKEAGAKGGSA